MKKIIWNVILLHVGLICWMALWIPSPEKLKKPIHVRTVSLMKTPSSPITHKAVTPPQNELAKKDVGNIDPEAVSQAAIKTVAPKKNNQVQKSPSAKQVSKKSKATSKKKQVPQYLFNQLQESIAKIEQNRHKEMPQGKLSVPTHFLKVEASENDEGNEFTASLIECFQKELHLPEVGEVKVELTLKQDGSLVEMKLLSKESQYNAQFLEKALQAMQFPSFKGKLAKQKEHTFVITFCNR